MKSPGHPTRALVNQRLRLMCALGFVCRHDSSGLLSRLRQLRGKRIDRPCLYRLLASADADAFSEGGNGFGLFFTGKDIHGA
jgi:hypothetical protein